MKRMICRRLLHTVLQKLTPGVMTSEEDDLQTPSSHRAFVERSRGQTRGGKGKRRKENKQVEATRRETKRKEKRRGEKIGGGNKTGPVYLNFVLHRSWTRHRSSLDVIWEVWFVRSHCHNGPDHAFRNTFSLRHDFQAGQCSVFSIYQ